MTCVLWFKIRAGPNTCILRVAITSATSFVVAVTNTVDLDGLPSYRTPVVRRSTAFPKSSILHGGCRACVRPNFSADQGQVFSGNVGFCAEQGELLRKHQAQSPLLDQLGVTSFWHSHQLQGSLRGNVCSSFLASTLVQVAESFRWRLTSLAKQIRVGRRLSGWLGRASLWAFWR